MTDLTKINTLADLLASLQTAVQRAAPVPVDVPELGGMVYVAPLSTSEWLDPAVTAPPDTCTPAQKRGWGVARWLCDAAGNRLVTGSNLQVLDLFAALPWEASHRILHAAGVLAGDQKNG
jgi:hypothetical protein